MADVQIPEGLTAEYANDDVAAAIRALQDTPDYERLAALLTALRTGYLIVDVTGASKKKSTNIRTIRSTQGQLLLPVFTSMAELRLAIPGAKASEAKGAIMPADAALRLIRTRPFVAAQFNPGSSAFVMLRAYVELVLGDKDITVQRLESFRS